MAAPLTAQPPASRRPATGTAPPQAVCGRQSTRPQSAALALGLILAAVVLYATAVRDGHDWGGDYAQYILHARAIVEGLDYAPPPGFIVNPYLVWVPPAYPPFYPLCIAGVLALFGLNFVVLKLQIVAFFGLALYAYWRLLRSAMPARIALGALAFLAFSPYFLKYANKILTEIPYLAVSLLAVLAAERFFRRRPSLTDAAGLALLLALACSTRSIGLALVLAVPAYALCFKRTHLLKAVLVALAAFALLQAISPTASAMGVYFNQTRSDPLRILNWLEGKPQGYFEQLMRYFALYPRSGSGLALALNAPATALYLALAALGAGHLVYRRRVRCHDIYTAGFIVAVWIYPLPRVRYVLPILPFISIYAFGGLRLLYALSRKRLGLPPRLPSLLKRLYRYRFAAPALLYLPLFAVYWGHYTFRPATPGANILADPNVRDLFAAVQEPRYGISGVIFDRPRVLTLFTGIPAAACFNAPGYLESDVTWDLPRLLDLADQGGISHIVLDRRKSATWQAIHPIMEGYPARFRHVYGNPAFDVYRILFP